jgi:hypothetical protein
MQSTCLQCTPFEKSTHDTGFVYGRLFPKSAISLLMRVRWKYLFVEQKSIRNTTIVLIVILHNKHALAT